MYVTAAASDRAISDAGVTYGSLAPKATGTGLTQTVRTGLQLFAASQTYAKLRGLRGKVRFSATSADLKIDR